MVRSTILLSAIIACIGSISAIPAPEGSLVNVQSGRHIGVGDVHIKDSLNGLAEIHDNEVKDIGQNIRVLSSGDDGNFGGDSDGNGDWDFGDNDGGNGGNGGNNGGNGGNGGRPPINRPSRRPHRPHRPFRPDFGGDYDHVHGPGCGCMKRDNGIDLVKRGDHRRSSKGNHKGRSRNGKATMNKMDSKSA